MKAYKVDNTFDLTCMPCPVCKSPLKILTALSEARVSDAESSTIIQSKTVDILSEPYRCKDYVRGKICFCLNCNKLMFLYVVEDTRKCKNCPHFHWDGSGSMHRGYCKWFNCDIPSNYNGAERAVCVHVDDILPGKAPYYAICALCSYSETDHSDGTCSCIHPRVRYGSCASREEKDLYDPMKACYGFTLDYRKYKEYRRFFDSQDNFFDESIHIPEYDAIIKDSSVVIEQDVFLSWTNVQIPVRVRVCTHAMNDEEFLINIYYDGENFFSEVYPKNGLLCEGEFELVRNALATRSGELGSAISLAFSEHVHTKLNLDLEDILKKYRA